MRQFHLVTRWSFDVPADRVWSVLEQPERFPECWPGFERAERVSGEGEVGSVTRYRVRGDFGLVYDFTLTVAARRRPEYLRLVAEGDFAGVGEWHLTALPESTTVRYTWDVDVTRPWLRLAARLPGAQARLTASHDRVMVAGGANLARLLEAADAAEPEAVSLAR